MRYLKRYEAKYQDNETFKPLTKSEIEMRTEIESLCESCLTYLMDKGYMYSVIVRGNHIEICINHRDMVGGLIGDAIDDIIPLYEILLKDYDLFYCGIAYGDSDRELPERQEIDKLLILSDDFMINWKDKYLAELKIGIRKF